MKWSLNVYFVSSEIPDDISSIKRAKTGGYGTSIGSSEPALRTLKLNTNHGTAGIEMTNNNNNTNVLGTSFAQNYTDNNILETSADIRKKTDKDGDIHSPSGTQRRYTPSNYCSIENDVESNNNKLFNNG